MSEQASTKPRLTQLATCPDCARGIAVRFNRAGSPVIYAHMGESGGKCPAGGREIDPHWLDVIHPWAALRANPAPKETA